VARCELTRTCIFFNDMMGTRPDTAALLKARYCKASFRECARYAVYQSLGREAVPDDLAPNDRLRGLTFARDVGHKNGSSLAPR